MEEMLGAGSYMLRASPASEYAGLVPVEERFQWQFRPLAVINPLQTTWFGRGTVRSRVALLLRSTEVAACPSICNFTDPPDQPIGWVLPHCLATASGRVSATGPYPRSRGLGGKVKGVGRPTSSPTLALSFLSPHRVAPPLQSPCFRAGWSNPKAPNCPD